MNVLLPLFVQAGILSILLPVLVLVPVLTFMGLAVTLWLGALEDPKVECKQSQKRMAVAGYVITNLLFLYYAHLICDKVAFDLSSGSPPDWE